MSDKPKSHGRLKATPTLAPREVMTERPELADAWVAKVITLGTPYAGTGLANAGLGRNARQMRLPSSRVSGPDGEWLECLLRDADPDRRALFVSIYSLHDNIISPAESAHLEGARNIAHAGIGHVALGLDRRIHEEVIAEIRAAARAAPAGMQRLPDPAPTAEAAADTPRRANNVRKDLS